MGQLVKVLVFGDQHEFYLYSRLKDGLPPESIPALGKYQLVIGLGDDVDVRYSVYCQYQKFKEEHPHERTHFKKNGHLHLNYSLKPELQRTVDEGVARKKKILMACPNTVFIDLLANHTNFHRYATQLDLLQQEFPERYACFAEFFILGDGFYTHGDLPLGNKSLENRQMERLKSFTKNVVGWKIWLDHKAHDFVQANIMDKWNCAPWVMERFEEYLEKLPTGWIKDAIKKTVHRFYGHTHVPPYNEEIVTKAGVKQHHQTGASLNKRLCNPVEFEIELPDGVTLDQFLTHQREHANVLFPEAKIRDVRQVYIPGLSYKPKSHEARLIDSHMSKAFAMRHK